MSEKYIEILSKRKYVPSDDTSLTSYTHYLVDRQHCVAFKRNPTSKKSRLLDLMHINLCSMGDIIIGGALYFVTFVNTVILLRHFIRPMILNLRNSFLKLYSKMM
jgi:hypothetical protein